MDATSAQTRALEALAEIASDKNTKPELRIEASKVILNRPRFFVDEHHKEQ